MAREAASRCPKKLEAVSWSLSRKLKKMNAPTVEHFKPAPTVEHFKPRSRNGKRKIDKARIRRTVLCDGRQMWWRDANELPL